MLSDKNSEFIFTSAISVEYKYKIILVILQIIVNVVVIEKDGCI